MIICANYFTRYLRFVKLIFTDLKGELFNLLSKSLSEKGYKILTLNLREPKFSLGWNPLAIAYKYHYDAICFKNNYQTIIVKSEKEIEKYFQRYLCFIHEKLECNFYVTKHYLTLTMDIKFIYERINF